VIPDYCDAITAYRCFNVHPNGLLTGQAHAEPWPPYQPFVGRCGQVQSAEAHIVDGCFVSAPAFRCDCGIHALKTLARAEQRAHGNSGMFAISFGFTDVQVWGAVKLWGRIIEHTDGYRAEFAYPSELYCQHEKLARKVSTLYGVPCTVKTLTPQTEVDEDGFAFYTSRWFTVPTKYYQPIVLSQGLIAWDTPSASSLTTLADDISDKSMVIAPQLPTIAPPKIVAATRWQQRQYANHYAKDIKVPDWRAILRRMVYKHAPVV
jgi:hypothetical protein